MAAQLFRGPNGVVFAPADAVHEDTVAQRVESGEWVPVDDKEKPKPAAKRAAKRAQAKK